MKIEIDRDELAAGLSRAKGVVSRDAGMPILRSVLLTTEGEKMVRLLGTDLDLSLRTQVEALVKEAGTAVIPAKESLDVVRGFAERKVLVECGAEGKVTLIAGRSKRCLPCLPSEDFPSVQSLDPPDFESCARAPLVTALESVLYTVPAEAGAYSIPGAYVSGRPDGLVRLFASDGHRLAIADLPGAGWGSLPPDMYLILPRKGIIEMIKLCDGEGELSLALQESGVVVKTMAGVLSVKSLEGGIPDYEVIIPESRPFSAVADARELLSRLKSMAVLAVGKLQALRLQFEGDKLTLNVVNGDLGYAEDEMDIEGDVTFTIYMNLRYMIDMLSSIGGEKVRLEWLDDMHGMVFTEPHRSDRLHLIMPMVV